MESLDYNFPGVIFKNMMKAQFRKYFDEIYKGKNLVIDIRRRLIDKDHLEIHRVHFIDLYVFKNNYVEKIVVDRINKTYKSWINTYQYKEECQFIEKPEGISYNQKYSAPFVMKWKKKEVFKKGCEVLNKILVNGSYN